MKYRLVLTATAFGACIAAFTAACENGHPVTYDNQTSHVIRIYVDGHLDWTLKPAERKTVGELEFRQRTWRAVDEAGQVVFERRLTPDDLQEMNWTIVFRD